MKNKFILTLLSILPLAGCVYGSNKTALLVDAASLDIYNDFEARELKISGYVFSYTNVYKNEDDEFVFSETGFLLSVNGIPDNILTLTHTRGFTVYGLGYYDEEPEVIEASLTHDDENDVDEYNFLLAGYNNFKITNDIPTDNVLGFLKFWS